MKTKNYSLKATILCTIHSAFYALYLCMKYPGRHFFRDLKLEFRDNMKNVFLF